MAARLCLFLGIVLFASKCASEFKTMLIVWNVGQGQWATLRTNDSCWHLDMGGEFAPWSQIVQICRYSKNYVSLSHWDFDHISFVGRMRNSLPNSCLLNIPSGKTSSRKSKAIHALPRCTITSPLQQWSNPSGHTSNSNSLVVLWQNVLAPGDSGLKEESLWSRDLSGIAKTKYLILGHHGSRTSTGEELLQRLPHLRLAIASAREKRYGHPHQEVISKLTKRKVPMLRTEDWGSIYIYL